MDSFRDTSKTFILVKSFYIVVCLQNKTFVDRVQKYFGSGNCWGKSTENLAALLWFFFSPTYLTYFSDTMLLSTVWKSFKFILSLFLVFLNTEYLCFSFLMYWHAILYKNNFSICGNLLPGHVNRRSKQFAKLTLLTFLMILRSF